VGRRLVGAGLQLPGGTQILEEVGGSEARQVEELVLLEGLEDDGEGEVVGARVEGGFVEEGRGGAGRVRVLFEYVERFFALGFGLGHLDVVVEDEEVAELLRDLVCEEGN